MVRRKLCVVWTTVLSVPFKLLRQVKLVLDVITLARRCLSDVNGNVITRVVAVTVRVLKVVFMLVVPSSHQLIHQATVPALKISRAFALPLLCFVALFPSALVLRVSDTVTVHCG